MEFIEVIMIEGDFKEMGPRSVNNIVNKGGTY
jgi:6-phosphofructokinase 1